MLSLVTKIGRIVYVEALRLAIDAQADGIAF